MSHFDYETGARKPEISGVSGGLGILLLLVVAIGLLALFSFFGGGTTPSVSYDTGAPAAAVPAAPAPATD